MSKGSKGARLGQEALLRKLLQTRLGRALSRAEGDRLAQRLQTESLDTMTAHLLTSSPAELEAWLRAD